MCGRFTLTTGLDVASVAALFGVQMRGQTFYPRYNIAPTQLSAAVLMEGDERVLDTLRWGIETRWARNRSAARSFINARAETLETRSVFRDAFARRRCLIPSDGFYEWGGRERAPHWIRLNEEVPFAFAGLYERRVGVSRGILGTFAIITTEPNEIVRSLHDRMPVIIRRECYDRWLDPTRSGAELCSLLRPYPNDEMTATRVSRTVNHVDAEGPACILPTPNSNSESNNLELFKEDIHG